MRVQMLDLDLLDARADARAVDADKVRAIAKSLPDVGLLNPIQVRPAPEAAGRFEIVAGMHRVEAHRALGLAEIEAIVLDIGDLFAELAMIDENLCRAELGPADRARQVARRKAIYLELHPETAQHVAGAHAANMAQGNASANLSPAFAANTAATTGQSERTVQREAERGEKISPDVLELVRGTDLDTGTFLDKLKKFSADQQRMLVERELEALERGNPNAHRATMHRRVEPDDSLNYFPTPPWATRALMEVVLPQLGVAPGAPLGLLWDPACGEGHITGVLAEYSGQVEASDIFDYGVTDEAGRGRFPPAWVGTQDFLEVEDGPHVEWPEWIITNPPFGAVTLPFILKALKLARVGVAMLVRQQWLEGVNRFRDLFSQQPPALIGQFVERVPMHKGRWEPEGDTLTAYVWVVWVKAPGVALKNGDTRFFWIPDGQRDALSKPDDVARFTAHPCLGPGETVVAEVAPVVPAETQAGDGNGLRLKGNATLAPRSVGARESDTLADASGISQREDDASPPPPPTEQQSAIDADSEEQELIEIRRSTADSAEPGAPAPALASAAGALEPASAVADSGDGVAEAIRAGYARNAPLSVIAEATGLTARAVQKRAKRMQLTSADRQRAAVAEANRRRGQPAGARQEEPSGARQEEQDIQKEGEPWAS